MHAMQRGARWRGIWYEPCSCTARSPQHMLFVTALIVTLVGRRLRVDVLLSRSAASLVYASSANASRPAPFVLRSRGALGKPRRVARRFSRSGAVPRRRRGSLASLLAGRARGPGARAAPRLVAPHDRARMADAAGLRSAPSAGSRSCFPRTTMAITETPISSLATFSASTMRRLGRSSPGLLRPAAGRATPAGAPRGGLPARA